MTHPDELHEGSTPQDWWQPWYADDAHDQRQAAQIATAILDDAGKYGRQPLPPDTGPGGWHERHFRRAGDPQRQPGNPHLIPWDGRP